MKRQLGNETKLNEISTQSVHGYRVYEAHLSRTADSRIGGYVSAY